MLGKKLRIETLESKTMLAGDVAVSVVDGNLLLEGDELANEFAVTRLFDNGSPVSGAFELTDTDPIGNTTFNGMASYVVTGVTGDIIANLAGGDDDILIVGDSIPIAGISIDTGTGVGDEVRLTDTEVTNDVVVDSSLGSFVLEFDNVIIGDDLYAIGGDAQNSLLIGNSSVGDDLVITNGTDFLDAELIALEVGGDLRIETSAEESTLSVIESSVGDDLIYVGGDGFDIVVLEEVSIGDNLWIDVNDGEENIVEIFADSSVGISTTIAFGDGENALFVEDFNSGVALTVLAEGFSEIELNNISSAGLLTVITSNGQAEIQLNDVQSGIATIKTGGGDDAISIRDSCFASLLLDLGSGDDYIELGGVEAFLALLSGGKGFDTLEITDINDIAIGLAFSFEDVLENVA